MSVFTLDGADHILVATARAVDFHHWSSFQDRHALKAIMRKRMPRLWEATFGARERMGRDGTTDIADASGFAFRDGYALPAMGIEMRGMEILGAIICTNELARGFRLLLFESRDTYAAGGDDFSVGIVEIPLVNGWDRPEEFFLSNKDKDIVAQLVDYAFGKSSYGERGGHIHDLIDLYDMQIVSDRDEIARLCTDPSGRCHVMLGTAGERDGERPSQATGDDAPTGTRESVPSPSPATTGPMPASPWRPSGDGNTGEGAGEPIGPRWPTEEPVRAVASDPLIRGGMAEPTPAGHPSPHDAWATPQEAPGASQGNDPGETDDTDGFSDYEDDFSDYEDDEDLSDFTDDDGPARPEAPGDTGETGNAGAAGHGYGVSEPDETGQDGDFDDFEDVSESDDADDAEEETLPATPGLHDADDGAQDGEPIVTPEYDDADALPGSTPVTVIGWEIAEADDERADAADAGAGAEPMPDAPLAFDDDMLRACEALREACAVPIEDVHMAQAREIADGRAIAIPDQSDTPIPLMLAALALALRGRKVHLVAKGDASARLLAETLMGATSRLGLLTGFLYKGQGAESRVTAYGADVVCATANEIGCWHLRSSLGTEPGAAPSEECALVEGLDGLLLGHGSLSISLKGDPDARDGEAYRAFAAAVRDLVASPSPDTPLDSTGYDCVPRPDERAVHLTKAGVQKVMAGIGEVARRRGYDKEFIGRHMRLALDAKFFLERDSDYVVTNREIRIIDKRTGHVLDGPRYSNGLHQAVEAKEGVPIHKMGQTIASVTVSDLFKRYGMLAGTSWAGDQATIEGLRDEYGIAFGTV